MKIVNWLFLLCICLITVVLINTSHSYANARLKFDNQNVSFEKLPDEWKITGATKFNFYTAKRTPPVAKFFAKASKIKSDDNRSVEEHAISWLKFMEKKYSWKNCQIKENGLEEIDGENAYWFIADHKWNGKLIKQKVYSVHHNGIRYIFRIMAIADDYNKTINEFNLWIKSLLFLK